MKRWRFFTFVQHARVKGNRHTYWIQNSVFVGSRPTSGTMDINVEYEVDGSIVTVVGTNIMDQKFFYDPNLQCCSCGTTNKGKLYTFKDYESDTASVSGLTWCGYCNTIFGGTIIKK